MPVSFSKSALWVKSACEIGLLLARKSTVLPWNFFQSKSAARAEPANPTAITESMNCAAKVLALIDSSLVGCAALAGSVRNENGYILSLPGLLSSLAWITTYGYKMPEHSAFATIIILCNALH